MFYVSWDDCCGGEIRVEFEHRWSFYFPEWIPEGGCCHENVVWSIQDSVGKDVYQSAGSCPVDTFGNAKVIRGGTWDCVNPWTVIVFNGCLYPINYGYKDGTEHSLKIMQDNEGSWGPLSVTYKDEEIDSISYLLSAKVTDFGGYDSIKVDRSDTKVTMYIIKDGESIFSDSLKGSSDMTITSSTAKTVINFEYLSSWIEEETPTDGTYGISFVPGGSCKYWGYPGENKITATLPSGKAVIVDVTHDAGGQIIFTLSGNVGA
ncbi:unnamed protein product, partial [marine sediment metagenome]